MFRSHFSTKKAKKKGKDIFLQFFLREMCCLKMFFHVRIVSSIGFSLSLRRPKGCSNDLFTGHAEKTEVDMGQQKFIVKRKQEMTFEVFLKHIYFSFTNSCDRIIRLKLRENS